MPVPTAQERAAHAEREGRMRPLVDKVIDQFAKGLLTTEELAFALIEIDANTN